MVSWVNKGDCVLGMQNLTIQQMMMCDWLDDGHLAKHVYFFVEHANIVFLFIVREAENKSAEIGKAQQNEKSSNFHPSFTVLSCNKNNV